MKRDEIGACTDRSVQRGDVRVADEWLRRSRPGFVVHAFEQTDGPIAAAKTPDGVDGRIACDGVEVGEPFVVRAGEISASHEHILPNDWVPTKFANVLFRATKVFFTAQRSGWCNECDARAGLERGRSTHSVRDDECRTGHCGATQIK